MSIAVSGNGVITAVTALPFEIFGTCAYGVYKAAYMLKKTDAKVLARLEKNRKELETQQVLSTPDSLKSKFASDLKQFKEIIKSFKLKPEEEQLYAHAYALETSGLGRFLSPTNQKLFTEQGNISEKDSKRLVKDALNNYKTASFDHTRQSIIEAAKESGFDHKVSVKKTLIGMHITATNNIGQAIVVLADSTDNGVKLHADTTGFRNGECTGIMDSFIKALSKRHIHITNLKKKEHWQEEGILNKYTEQKEKEISAPIDEQNVQLRESKKSSLRRKLNIFYQKQKSKL